MKTWRFLLVLVLGVVGAVIAAHLTSIHIRHLISGQASACDFTKTLGAGWNCDAVNTSDWSEVAGVPVSHLGFLAYIFMVSIAIGALLRERVRGMAQAALLVLAAVSVLTSLLLAFISVFVIKAVCVFCMSLYAVNLALLGVLLPGAQSALRELPSLSRALQRPLVALLVLGWLAGAALSAWQLRGAVKVAKAFAQANATVKSQLAAANESGPAPTARVDLTDSELPTLGPSTAPIRIVEVSDFECPFCQKASGILAELLALDAYKGKLSVQFRHFPLDQACNSLLKRPLHENACAAARAAVCAASPKTGGGNEKFWAYAKKLFDGDVEAADLTRHARELGLDGAAFAACQAAPETAQVVARDLARAAQAGVTAVPVFFINGRKLAGAQPIEKFRQIIDEELAAQPAK